MFALLFKKILIKSLLCLNISNAYFTVDFGAVGKWDVNQTSIRYLSSPECLSSASTFLLLSVLRCLCRDSFLVFILN